MKRSMKRSQQETNLSQVRDLGVCYDIGLGLGHRIASLHIWLMQILLNSVSCHPTGGIRSTATPCLHHTSHHMCE